MFLRSLSPRRLWRAIENSVFEPSSCVRLCVSAPCMLTSLLDCVARGVSGGTSVRASACWFAPEAMVSLSQRSAAGAPFVASGGWVSKAARCRAEPACTRLTAHDATPRSDPWMRCSESTLPKRSLTSRCRGRTVACGARAARIPRRGFASSSRGCVAMARDTCMPASKPRHLRRRARDVALRRGPSRQRGESDGDSCVCRESAQPDQDRSHRCRADRALLCDATAKRVDAHAARHPRAPGAGAPT